LTSTILHGVGQTTINYNLTRYAPLQGNGRNATEANVQTDINSSVTFSNYWVSVGANTIAVATTVRLRKNGANGNEAISIPASTTGKFEDTSNTDSISAGDLVDFATVTGGSSGYTQIMHRVLSAADTPPQVLLSYSGYGTAYNSTRYCTIVGQGAYAAGEGDFKWRSRKSWTVSHLRVYVPTNTCNNSSTYRLRKNGANGNESVSVPASTTGAFEDNSNTDSIASGDQLNYQLATGGTSGSITTAVTQCQCAQPAGNFHPLITADEGTTLYALQVRYVPVFGDIYNDTFTSESNAQCKSGSSTKLSNFFVRLISNSCDGASTFRTRKNGANGNLSVSVPASTYGEFEDTSDVDELVSDDLINYQQTAGGSSGQMMISYHATTSGFVLGSTVYGIDATLIRRTAVSLGIDILLLKTIVGAYAVHALLEKEGISREFAIDALVRKLNLEVSFGIDMPMVLRQPIQYAIDLLTKRQDLSQEFVLDVFIKAVDEAVNYGIDTVLRKQESRTYGFDVFMLKTLLSACLVDALLLKKDVGSSYAADALLKSLNIQRSHAVDALLKKLGLESQYGSDLMLKRLDQTLAFQIDAAVKKIRSNALAIDAILKRRRIQAGYEIDILLAETGKFAQLAADAILVKRSLVQYVVDSILKREDVVRSFGIDMVLGNVRGFLIDALLSKLEISAGYAADAMIAILDKSAQFAIDAVLGYEDVPREWQMDIVLKRLGAVSDYAANMILVFREEQGFAIDLALSKTFPTTFNADMVLALLNASQDYPMDLLLQRFDLIATYPIDALLQELGLTRQHSIDALLSKLSLTGDHGVDLLLKGLNLESDYGIDLIIRWLMKAASYSIDTFLHRLGITASYPIDVLLSKIWVSKAYAVDTRLLGPPDKFFGILATKRRGIMIRASQRNITLATVGMEAPED